MNYETVTVDGRLQSFATINSDRPGRPVLVNSGWPFGPQSWTLMTPFLDDAPLILPFMPGFGGTQSLAEPLTWPTLAASQIKLMQHLDIKKTNQLGISFGAVLNTYIASQKPDLVHNMVAIALPNNFESHMKGFRRMLWRLTETNRGLKKYIYDELMKPNKLFWTKILGAAPDLTDPFENAVFAEVKTGSLQAFEETLRMIMGIKLEFLHSITARTLIIVGTRDYAYADSYLAAQAIGASFKAIPEAGHSLTHDNPQEVARLVNEFFASQP